MTDFCSICLDDFKNPRRTQCGHIFCYDCIWEWKNEENYYGEKKETCPLCRSKIGLLTRVNMKIKMKNKKITKKKEPIKRVYRTRYKIAEERIRVILSAFNNALSIPVEQLWNMSSKVSVEGAQYLRHNKDMRETFNRKMTEFGRYDSRFLTLIKK